jgi:hypothetical protein
MTSTGLFKRAKWAQLLYATRKFSACFSGCCQLVSISIHMLHFSAGAWGCNLLSRRSRQVRDPGLDFMLKIYKHRLYLTQSPFKFLSIHSGPSCFSLKLSSRRSYAELLHHYIVFGGPYVSRHPSSSSRIQCR